MLRDDIIVILLHVIIIGIPIFWIWMLIDSIMVKKKQLKHTSKIVWILIIIFVAWLGAIIYYILEKRRRKK